MGDHVPAFLMRELRIDTAAEEPEPVEPRTGRVPNRRRPPTAAPAEAAAQEPPRPRRRIPQPRRHSAAPATDAA